MHGPRNVVADREMIEHVPHQHAHVVIAEKWQTRDVQPRSRERRSERTSIGRVRIGGMPRLSARVDADRVAGLERDAASFHDVFELPPVHGSILRHAGHAAVPRHVEHHAARDDAVGPVLDRAKGRAVERDLALRITAVPHRLLVPRVAERVDVSRRHTVIEDAVVVAGKSAVAARDDAHEVLRREGVADSGVLGKRTAQRYGAPAPHQSRGGRALGRRDEVDRADLVVLPPTPPVPAVTDVRAHFRFRGQCSLRHVLPPSPVFATCFTIEAPTSPTPRTLSHDQNAKALVRSPGFSRMPGSGWSAKRRVISLMIDVVSYGVLSTYPRLANGDTMIVGIRAAGPHRSLQPGPEGGGT